MSKNCRDVMNIYIQYFNSTDAQATVGERTNNFYVLESDFHTFFSAWTLEQFSFVYVILKAFFFAFSSLYTLPATLCVCVCVCGG